MALIQDQSLSSASVSPDESHSNMGKLEPVKTCTLDLLEKLQSGLDAETDSILDSVSQISD